MAPTTTITSESEPDFKDLFQDDNLLAVFLHSPTVLKNGFNRWCICITALALSGFATFRFFYEPSVQHPAFSETFLSWATVGWTLSSTLLGFLIAGFALLCTVFRPGTVKRLHDIVQPGESNNVLRNLLMFFVDVFIQFLALLFVSIVFQIILAKGGPSHEIRQFLLLISPKAPELTGYVTFVIWGTWFVVLVMKLKSFVYNLYQALVLGMADNVHYPGES